MAMGGSKNHEEWTVAHVAAFHDDLKLLSLASEEQLWATNRWGLTPAHMCCMGVHPHGAALFVLYALIEAGAVDPDARTLQGQTPWHLCQRNQSAEHLKLFERVMYKGFKPEGYDEQREAQLRPRGKFARSSSSSIAATAAALSPEQELQQVLPVCLLFPGQGSQNVGMLSALKDVPAVRSMLQTAERILGYDLLQLCLEGPEERLAQTKYCQPAMFVAGLAALEQLRLDSPAKVSHCMAVAGLSLGEYTALAAADVFDFEVGLQLVRARAEAMELETLKPGAHAQAMASVAGLDRDVVERLCRECASNGDVCQIANYLFPKGFSVAGEKSAVEAFEVKAKAAGALQVKLLKTSGAFHTPLMRGARETLLQALSSLKDKMRSPKCKVYMNVSAQPIDRGTPVEDIIEVLGNQLVSPVMWEDSMRRAIEDGCTEFFECGPNKQLRSMMKRINLPIHNAMVNVAA
eukprot:TRINITY_DN57020_c0_g1_i1.p1 TRINITY_DN57020_c0_g1~~TRINITY_DN57020_c0_g1_i1.p1  ORF type:complete len:534 (-),score=85.61 TRINITY_DN57020_c0_g1_i1:68-1456(-)